MTIFNCFYSNKINFIKDLNTNNITDSNIILIQVFSAASKLKKLQEVLGLIKETLPSSSIISTTTAGEIVEGGMANDTIVISIATFEATSIKLDIFEKNEAKSIAKSITTTLVSPTTKLLLMFNNPFHIDAEEVMNEINILYPHLVIAGGNSADNYQFRETWVGANETLSSTGLVVVALDSEVLQVANGYLLNWNKIGASMKVTSATKNIIHTINNRPALEVYRYYLGDEVANNLPEAGIEFPLIFNDDNIDIARAPISVLDDGSLVMAGHIKESTRVQFSFGNNNYNELQMQDLVASFAEHPVEALFIYSCSARKAFFKESLNSEFNLLQEVAPTAGFITYGEFYHEKHNHLLNVTSTYIALNEFKKKTVPIKNKKIRSTATRTFNALHHLVETTAQELEEKHTRLTQFQSLVRNATIYSTTDTKGIITDANDRFCELSGYTKEELIGQAHSIVRHKDIDKSVYEEMWKTLKAKKTWKGVIKNMAKDGSIYYVRSNIIPILDNFDNILYYVSIRDDITHEMMHTKKNENLLNQYQSLIESSSAFLRVNTSLKIISTNQVLNEVFHEQFQNLIGQDISKILQPYFYKHTVPLIMNTLNKQKEWSGIIKLQNSFQKIIHMDSTIRAIYDEDEKIVEYMVVMHDITEIINTQDEIKKIQSDVVFTMGAIGESRSKETGNHVKRVAEYSKQLALLYGLSRDEAELLKMASPMHDIGKVGIPDTILNKPGKLTSDEFKIMKTHSRLGYEMLKHSNKEILKAAATVALTHHERWDAQGYPKGLKAQEIPIFGRITALADVFDALGSDRCYKKAWEDEAIFTLLKEQSAKHFDPKLVELFFDNLDLFLEIRKKFRG